MVQRVSLFIGPEKDVINFAWKKLLFLCFIFLSSLDSHLAPKMNWERCSNWSFQQLLIRFIHYPRGHTLIRYGNRIFIKLSFSRRTRIFSMDYHIIKEDLHRKLGIFILPIVSDCTNVFIVTWLSYAEEELAYSLALAPDWLTKC